MRPTVDVFASIRRDKMPGPMGFQCVSWRAGMKFTVEQCGQLWRRRNHSHERCKSGLRPGWPRLGRRATRMLQATLTLNAVKPRAVTPGSRALPPGHPAGYAHTDLPWNP